MSTVVDADARLAELCASAGHGPIAVDAMGGDNAPAEVVAGARLAVREMGIPVLLVGRPDELVGAEPTSTIVSASEVIAMDADPGASVRRLKDSSMVRAAESVRDGVASAMVSAGNTGAAMAASLLRMGRIRGIARPAIAIPLPCPTGKPTIMLDAGANAECQSDWLVQFGQMGAVYARLRYGDRPAPGRAHVDRRGVGQGQQPGQGGPPADERPRLARPRRRRVHRATSRAVTSCLPMSTWSSPTGSPATWPSRRWRVPWRRDGWPRGPRRWRPGASSTPPASWAVRSTPRPPAGRCCWACGACRSSATARRRPGPSPTPSTPPRRCCGWTSSRPSARRWAITKAAPGDTKAAPGTDAAPGRLIRHR